MFTLLQDIISGYDKFNEILNVHKEVKFPAVYLGIALMFQKLNRYEQALINAEKGVEWFDNSLPCLTYRFVHCMIIFLRSEPFIKS